MGTRGSIGFKLDGEYKATYNHYDSYPSYLGKKIVEFIRTKDTNDWQKFIENYRKVRFVSNDYIPTIEDKKKYKKYSDLDVSNKSLDDVYCLLRNVQGITGLEEIDNGSLEMLIDNTDFIKDSLFCEYAYILDLDNKEFELYEGFQKNENGDYIECKKVATFSFNEIPDDWEQVYKDNE